MKILQKQNKKKQQHWNTFKLLKQKLKIPSYHESGGPRKLRGKRTNTKYQKLF